MKLAAGNAASRITVELIKGMLNATRREMEALITRTAMSPFIREKKDFFTAILNPAGELVVSTSLTLAGNLVDAILQQYPADTMQDGDLFWYNDPYATGGAVSHLPDMVFVMPVFAENRLVAFIECWGHLWDIGGAVPGSISPTASSVFQEGVMIPPVRVLHGGVRNEEVVRIFTRNSRFPDMLEGDLNSLMAACNLGRKRLEECTALHGANALENAFEAIISQTETALQQQISAHIPEGSWAFRDRIDSDAVSDRGYFVDVVMHQKKGKLSLDFSATDRQADGPINFIMDQSVPKFMLGLYLTRDIQGVGMNAGFQRAIGEVITRPGSLLAPRSPAPLGLRSHTMFRVNSALFGSLAQATGGAATAASSVYVLYYLRGTRLGGGEELCIEGLSVGYGGRQFADGLDAVYYVAQENYPVEFAEMEFGLTIEQFGVHCDSGGAGRHRGGCGIIRDVRVLLDDMNLGIRIDNSRYPAFGVNGGLAGASGRVLINPNTPEQREIRPLSDGTRIKKGDLIRIITPGGGGWGSPLERPAQQVLDDVLDGYVSVASAERDYGVILNANGDDIDIKATYEHRCSMSRPKAMFHRHGHYNADDDRKDSPET